MVFSWSFSNQLLPYITVLSSPLAPPIWNIWIFCISDYHVLVFCYALTFPTLQVIFANHITWLFNVSLCLVVSFRKVTSKVSSLKTYLDSKFWVKWDMTAYAYRKLEKYHLVSYDRMNVQTTIGGTESHKTKHNLYAM